GDEARIREILDSDPATISRQTARWDAVASFTGGTPLHIAALHGRLAVAELLLDRGAAVNALCLSEATPLHYTAMHGQVEMAKLLLDRGADLHARDPEHRSTALAWARFQRQPALVALLQERESSTPMR